MTLPARASQDLDVNHRAVGAGVIASVSLAFMLTGLVRQKLMVMKFGPDVLGAVGQANFFQALLMTIFGAGIVLGARVLLSDGRLPLQQRIEAGGWLMKRPFLLGCVLVPFAWVLGPMVSLFYTGSREWAFAFQMASLGAVLALFLSGATATVQILATRAEVVSSSAAAAGASVAVTIALVLVGNQDLALASLAVAPLVGSAAFLATSRTVRSVALVRARLDRPKLRRAAHIGAGSLVNGVLGLVVASWLSSRLAHSTSLSEVALLQPALLVSAAASLVTASVTSARLYRHNLTSAPGSDVRRRGPWPEALVFAGWMGIVLVLVSPMAPIGVLAFYDRTILPGTSLIGVQLAAETLTCVVWIAGSMLLPEGRVRLWMLATIVGQAAKLLVGLVLLPTLGAEAIPFASLVQYAVGVIALLIILRPRLGPGQYALLLALAVSAASMPLTWISFPTFNWLALGVTVVVLGVGLALGGGFSRDFQARYQVTRRRAASALVRLRRRMPNYRGFDSEVALANLTELTDALSECGVEHWLTDGTLLGMIREGCFIRHDLDTDIGVDARTFSREALLAVIRRGFEIKAIYGDPADSLEIVFQRNGVRTDFFFFYPMPGGGFYHSAFFDFSDTSAERIDYVYPPFSLERRRMLGREFWTPRDAEAYIETKYGAAWRTPVADWDWALGPANARRTGLRSQLDWGWARVEQVWGPLPSRVTRAEH
jgi:hypothetical protein